MKTRYFDNGRTAIAVCILFTVLGICARSTHAAPVQYLKICSIGPPGYFYIPGTDICQDANAIADNQFNVGREFSRAMVGIAMSSAIVSPFVPEQTNFAISFHWATYEGKNAFGLAGALRLYGNWALTGGIACGVDSGSVTISTIQQTQFGPSSPVRSWSSTDVMGTLGVNYSW
jgi:hypothetical protein